MRKLSANNLVRFIDQLDKNVVYHYVNPRNKGIIKIEGVELPEGPIRIKRWNPSKGETEKDKKIVPISSEMIWRAANNFKPNQPINLDRVLGGSYNTRSVLEALLVHTPQFYYCRPGRIENKGGKTEIKDGHKHLVWKPDNPHKPGVMVEAKSDIIISEIQIEAIYESLVLPDNYDDKFELDVDIARRHAQIQFALYFIGKQLEFRTWIAKNDMGILHQNKKFGEYDGVIASLKDVKLMSAFDEAIQAALLIDCIWFKNGTLMPAVMEIEHSTGVTSGLSRMKNFKDQFVNLKETRYVIVAPDELRDKVLKEANKPQFEDLDTKYFSYSSVEELYYLCQKRKIKGVTEEFLDCFMEPILE